MQNITYYLHFSILFSEYFKLADYMKLHRKHFLQSWEFHLDNFGHLLLLVLYHLTSGIMGITTIFGFYLLFLINLLQKQDRYVLMVLEWCKPNSNRFSAAYYANINGKIR